MRCNKLCSRSSGVGSIGRDGGMEGEGGGEEEGVEDEERRRSGGGKKEDEEEY